jgi:dynein heavy chain
VFGGACASCRTVATLQSNQLRGLVAASLTDYLAFFRQHKAAQQLDPQQDSCMWSCKPVFETELVAVEGEHDTVWCLQQLDKQAGVA